MASLTGEQLKDTYDSLLKVDDNGSLGGTYKEITDGLGNGSNLYLGTGGNVGIGTDSPNSVGSRKTLHVNDSSGSAIRLTESATDIAFLSYDTTNFLRISSSDQIAFLTSGSEAMRIDSTGNVGINDTVSANFTNNYDTKLLVGGDIVARSKTSNESMVAIGGDATSAFIKAGKQDASLTARALRFEVGNSEAMRIDSSGNVGIGTTSIDSNYKTHIEAGSGNNTSLLVTTTDNADVAQVIIGHDGGLQGGLQLVSDKTNGIAKIRVTNSSYHPLAFEVRGSDGTNERMRILSTGGITFNGDTATDNALDDYEEGSWTPAWDFATSGSVAITVSSATYTKIGRMVSINARIFTTSISSPTGDATLTGLPFTAKSSIQSVPVSIGQGYRWGNNINNFRAYINSSSYIQFADNNYDDTATTSLVGADFDAAVGNKNVISISATYFV